MVKRRREGTCTAATPDVEAYASGETQLFLHCFSFTPVTTDHEHWSKWSSVEMLKVWSQQYNLKRSLSRTFNVVDNAWLQNILVLKLAQLILAYCILFWVALCIHLSRKMREEIQTCVWTVHSIVVANRRKVKVTFFGATCGSNLSILKRRRACLACPWLRRSYENHCL